MCRQSKPMSVGRKTFIFDYSISSAKKAAQLSRGLKVFAWSHLHSPKIQNHYFSENKTLPVCMNFGMNFKEKTEKKNF